MKLDRQDIQSLKDALNVLPEPILILGNRIPDGDSLGSAIAVLEHLRYEGMEAYIHCVVEPSQAISWMLGEEDTCEGILDDYASLVVVDDRVDSERLGIELKDVPTVCIDHHRGNFPDEVLEALEEMDTFDSPLIFFSKDDVISFLKFAPATACLLADEDIFHPYLWVSLYTDTVGFTVNCMEGIAYADWVARECELSTETLEGYIQNLKTYPPVIDLHNFTNGMFYTVTGSLNGEKITCAIALVEMQRDTSYAPMLDSLSRFAQVFGIVNRYTGKTSLRSSTYDFSVYDVAKEFGGGGHIRASGCTLDTETSIQQECDRLVGLMADQLEEPHMRIYL